MSKLLQWMPRFLQESTGKPSGQEVELLLHGSESFEIFCSQEIQSMERRVPTRVRSALKSAASNQSCPT